LRGNVAQHGEYSCRRICRELERELLQHQLEFTCEVARQDRRELLDLQRLDTYLAADRYLCIERDRQRMLVDARRERFGHPSAA